MGISTELWGDWMPSTVPVGIVASAVGYAFAAGIAYVSLLWYEANSFLTQHQDHPPLALPDFSIPPLCKVSRTALSKVHRAAGVLLCCQRYHPPRHV
jgi:hypothetical protein